MCVRLLVILLLDRNNISCSSLFWYLLEVEVDLSFPCCGILVCFCGLTLVPGISGFIATCTRGGCLSCCTRERQLSLFCASCSSSCHEYPDGVSIRRSPSFGLAWMYLTALRTMRCCGILKMCPTHCRRRARIQRTISNVLVLLLASSLMDLPVMREINRLLAPFSIAQACASSIQPSAPYTSREQTPVL